MPTKRYTVGIIGYGDFTRLMCEYLAPFADIVVSSRRHESGDAGFGAHFAPLNEVLSRPIIIPSFPSQFFESFFEEHGESINPNALIIDVCSVKVRPLEALQKYTPSTCSIIGTHPMFGPGSVRENGGIEGLRCVVSPVRADEDTVRALRAFLSEILYLKVLNYTPEEHDKMMAYVQGVSHYIARVMDILQIPETDLATIAYEDLLAMRSVQAQDSWDLFTSIMEDNPYAKPVNEKLKKAMAELDAKLDDNSHEELGAK